MFKFATVLKHNDVTNSLKPIPKPNTPYINKFNNTYSTKNIKSFQLFNNSQQKRHSAIDIAFYLTTGILVGGTLMYFAVPANTNHQIKKVGETSVQKDNSKIFKLKKCINKDHKATDK